jgi:hypothetical protein
MVGSLWMQLLQGGLVIHVVCPRPEFHASACRRQVVQIPYILL